MESEELWGKLTVVDELRVPRSLFTRAETPPRGRASKAAFFVIMAFNAEIIVGWKPWTVWMIVTASVSPTGPVPYYNQN